MARITVIGSAAVDIFLELPRYYLHRSVNKAEISLPFGQKLTAESSQLFLGGAGANVAVGLTKAGYNSLLITPKSEDTLSNFIAKELTKNEITLQALTTTLPTAFSVIFRLEAERTIIMSNPKLPPVPIASIETPDWLHIGPLHQESEQTYQDLQTFLAKHSLRLSLNPSISTIEEHSRGFSALLRLVDILFLNEEEAYGLARVPRSTPLETLLRSLQRLGPKIVCLTRGAQGAIVASAEEIWQGSATAGKNERVDATGGGDAFVSGFLASYLVPEDLENSALIERSLQFGLLNSGAVVCQIGAETGLLGFEEMRKDATTVTVRLVP